MILALRDLFPFAAIAAPPWIAPELLALAGGYLLWSLIYLFLPPSAALYIWGHELTHALWGRLSGARVGRIRIHRDGGSVMVEGAGIGTTLAPYFVPFYTLIVVLLRLLTGLLWPMERWELYWLALVGFTWSFHVTYTLRCLLQHQPDIRTYGRLFSYSLILLLNLLTLGYLLVAATQAGSRNYHHHLYQNIGASYRQSAATLRQGSQKGMACLRDIKDRY